MLSKGICLAYAERGAIKISIDMAIQLGKLRSAERVTSDVPTHTRGTNKRIPVNRSDDRRRGRSNSHVLPAVKGQGVCPMQKRGLSCVLVSNIA